ncbi:MAG: preprotein translocase subunit YajC [Oscillospiraceae bacterium]
MDPGMQSIFTVGTIVLMFVLLYFVMLRPQKKREKETQAMRSNLEIGDEITTIGGIIGIVVSMKDDTVVIETGSDRSKVRITRWAIQTNNTVKDK